MKVSAGLLIVVPLPRPHWLLHEWLPSVLAGSLVGLVGGVPPVAYVRPALVTLPAPVGLPWAAAARLQRLEP